ncbi:MAG TPA: DNA replication/repair protein RecF [Methylococcus sp.]|nr:DNA replication/repair protein RecF [Methylococcus sp.]
MALTKLEIGNLRNIEHAVLRPGQGLNFLCGDNGSGKTSVLESIYLLGRGRSFRSVHSHHAIRFEQAALTVCGRITIDGRNAVVGVQIGRNERQIRLDGIRCESSSQLVKAFPVLLVQPASGMLLEGPPKYRRQLLDWGVFHVEHGYVELWRRFSRALDQRNAALRSQSPKAVATWSAELARCGTMVAEARLAYAERIGSLFKEMTVHLLGIEDVDLVLAPGWKGGESYAEALDRTLDRDLRQGYTESGPHKADFSIVIQGRPAKDFLSRGQLKLLALALSLAQGVALEVSRPGEVCLLVDDFSSELDRRNQGRLLGVLRELGTQSFVTMTSRARWLGKGDNTATMFHVEQGRIFGPT